MGKPLVTNGFDIQRTYICAVKLDLRSTVVEQIAVQPLGDPEGDYWSAIFRELKTIGKNIRFTAREAVCSLPSDMSVVKVIDAEITEANQKDFLQFELEASLMGNIDDYVCDFYEVPSTDEAHRKYLAAAIRKETLAHLQKGLGGIKLVPQIIDMDLFALTHAFQTNYDDLANNAAFIVHGENEFSKIILVNNAAYLDYAVFEFDAQPGSESKYAAVLEEELGRLANRHADVSRDSTSVLLAGSLFADEQFSGFLTAGGVPGSEVFDPFRKISCAPNLDGNLLKRYAPQLAVSVGLALRGSEATK